MEAKLTWVTNEEEVPKGRKGGGAREVGIWAEMIAELRANPNKWAVIAESLDSAKVTALRYRFPDIDFRGKVVSRVTPEGKKMIHQKVWACYHEQSEPVVDEPKISVSLTVSQIAGLLGSLTKV